ncbi:hypothetical protein GCM10008096_15920 [Zhihengliuella salsuginis]|uniref:Uncharacterized protein n=1 Tax=Zhihengliuella salsuginis TaxID=578222 RepID=A0ABQ3GIY9_9MICC|nr:hypothetical protein GCM10008096_15920 [Zhihengliuella salsuginis]
MDDPEPVRQSPVWGGGTPLQTTRDQGVGIQQDPQQVPKIGPVSAPDPRIPLPQSSPYRVNGTLTEPDPDQLFGTSARGQELTVLGAYITE